MAIKPGTRIWVVVTLAAAVVLRVYGVNPYLAPGFARALLGAGARAIS